MSKFAVKTQDGTEVLVDLDRREGRSSLYARFFIGGEKFWLSTDSEVEKNARQIARELVCEKYKEYLSRCSEFLSIETSMNDYLKGRFPEAHEAREFTFKRKKGRIRDLDRHYTTTKNRIYLLRDFAKKLLPQEMNLKITSFEDFSALIQQFINNITKKYSAKTVVGFQRSISGYCSWMMKNRDQNFKRYISWDRNPASAQFITLPKIEVKIKYTPTSAELKKLMEKALEDKNPLFPVIVLLAGNGLRPRGAWRLKWEEINLFAGNVKTFEKGREREIALNNWTKEKLIEWQQQTGTKTGAVYTASYYTVFDRFKTLREAAGVSEGCTLQSLRRLNIRTARQAGVPADVLAKCAGHTIAVSTKHYADLDALNAGEHLNKISYA